MLYSITNIYSLKLRKEKSKIVKVKLIYYAL